MTNDSVNIQAKHGTGDAARRRRVVAVRFSALGDVAMTIPALYDACRANSGTDFVFVTRKAFTAIFLNAPANLTVLGIDLKSDYIGLRGMVRLGRQLHADVLVDLHDVLRTRALRLTMRLRGSRVAILDKCRGAKKRLVAHGAASTGIAIIPTVDRYRQAFEEAGIKCPESFRGLFAGHPADPSAYSAVCPAKAAGERRVGIAPFAAHRGKIYDPARMLDVARMLVCRDNTHIFLFGGGKEETEVLQAWARRLGPRAHCVAGSRIGFAGELALMSTLDVMVAMDSGNMHLAAIAGVPTVSVWGATHPAAGFAPYSTQSSRNILIQKEMDCRPCSVFGNRSCRYDDYRCLDIPPQCIADAAGTILNPLP